MNDEYLLLDALNTHKKKFLNHELMLIVSLFTRKSNDQCFLLVLICLMYFKQHR